MFRIAWFARAALLALCMIAVPALADAQNAAEERRVALVIGNSLYRDAPALANPQRAAVAAALRQVGFDTTLEADLDRAGMVKALEALSARANGADWALVYFAGHGIEIDRVNYLIPVDAKLADDHAVKDETVSFDALLNAVAGANAMRIIVLDASRDNPFRERMVRANPARGAGLAPPPETKVGTLVAYAVKSGEVAADDAGGSPFARAFAAEITRPGIELRRVFDNVRDDVLEATHNRQQPFIYGSLPGRRDFYFVARK
jgi:uncharacterized caspase-like protein